MTTGQANTNGVENGTAACRRGGGWVFPVLLAVVVGIAAWAAQHTRDAGNTGGAAAVDAGWIPSPRPAGETVALEIDFGNGAKKQLLALPWREEMTVVDVMQAARDFRPAIRFTQVGKGAGGFLTSLDGLTGEGAGGRNWRLEVDGRKAEISFCLQKVPPGGRVLWTFLREE